MTRKTLDTSSGTSGRQWAPAPRPADEAILVQLPGAMGKAERERNAGRRARGAYYDAESETVMVVLHSGFIVGFPVSLIQGLSEATPVQRSDIEVTPGGEGVLWPQANTDASVAGLMRVMMETLAMQQEPWRGTPEQPAPRIVGRVVNPEHVEPQVINPGSVSRVLSALRRNLRKLRRK